MAPVLKLAQFRDTERNFNTCIMQSLFPSKQSRFNNTRPQSDAYGKQIIYSYVGIFRVDTKFHFLFHFFTRNNEYIYFIICVKEIIFM